MIVVSSMVSDMGPGFCANEEEFWVDFVMRRRSSGWILG